MSESVKQCRDCGVTKPVSLFVKHRGKPNGVGSYCKSCAARHSREAREKYKDSPKHDRSRRSSKLKDKYGITLDDYDRMFAAQNGVCAVCNKPESRTYSGVPMRLCVDHNHTTGEVRDLLCTKCNFAIGLANEDPDILDKLSTYIKRHKGEIL